MNTTTTNMMTKLKKGKKYREAFVASQIDVGIPFQIRALRKQVDMDQKKLASVAGMLQPRISAMESPGYGSFTLETLKRLAAAFDVALVVRFAPFGELVRLSNNFSPDDFQVLSFDKELESIKTSAQNVLAFNILATATPQKQVGEENLYMPIESGYVPCGVVLANQNVSGIQQISLSGG